MPYHNRTMPCYAMPYLFMPHLRLQLLHNRPCFTAESMAALEVRISRGAHGAFRKDLSPGVRHLIKGTLLLAPVERMTAQRVGSHGWVVKT